MARPIDLEYPFTGRWLTQNSPTNRVPTASTPQRRRRRSARHRTVPVTFRMSLPRNGEIIEATF